MSSIGLSTIATVPSDDGNPGSEIASFGLLSDPVHLYQFDPSVVHRIWHSKFDVF